MARSPLPRGVLCALLGALALPVLASCAKSSTTTSAPGSSCGAEGQACSPEGASCSPAPLGTGWAHMLTCSRGKWHELEIAPMPLPPPTATSSSGATSQP